MTTAYLRNMILKRSVVEQSIRGDECRARKRFVLMEQGKSISAKITRPHLSGVIKRERLFGLLADTADKPVVWVSSPAGSGKTKLVSSYLDFCQSTGIWYSCDEGDADLATFFYYMGLAAQKALPRRKLSLPLLTQEYAGGIPVFTRKYFEKLYDHLTVRRPSQKGRGSFFLVFDNYQDVPEHSAFHEMIADAFYDIPDGIQAIVVSRSDPPAALARLRANDRLNVLGYDDIRFTPEEARELLCGRIPHLDEDVRKTIYERTEGWAAGIVLMLEKASFQRLHVGPEAQDGFERVFDYFAGEIFDKSPDDIREFLLKTAFPPFLSVPLAEELTQESQAGRILSSLNRRNYFTEKLAGGGQEYRYHPLFRDFLINRARASSTRAELAAMQREAGKLIEKAGQIEHAAKLYIDAGEAQDLTRMIIRHARNLLTQGRNKTLAEWIAAVPARTVGKHAWLCYWRGMCSLPFDMTVARKDLHRAFLLFTGQDEPTGVYLSWAGIVDTFAFELDAWKHLDQCIETFENLRRTYPHLSSGDVDLVASSRMLISLILRKTDQPKWVMQWYNRVSALLQEHPSEDIRMDVLFFVSLYYLWQGEYRKNAILLEKAKAEFFHHKTSPLAVIHIKMMQGIHEWVTAQYASAVKTLAEGLDIARQSGVHVFDSMFWSFTAAAQIASGDKQGARISLQNQMIIAWDTAKTLDIFFYHINAAWHALLDGDTAGASENLGMISATVVKMGTPYYLCLWHIGMAQVAHKGKRIREAKVHIQKAQRIGLSMKSRIMEWYSLLVSAWISLTEGKEKEGLSSLSRGMLLGRKNGYVHLEFYQPEMMQYLCARALNERIETDYVKDLIRKLRLLPPVFRDSVIGPCDLEDWPYPVIIHTLGKFEVFKEGAPLLDTGKVQKKPLEMLKIMIAEGGVNVPAMRLTDALWPDAEGDLAHKSFEMTLMRLRRLLGGDDFILYRAGQMSLNPQCLWVDSIALESLIEKIRKTPEKQSVRLCEKAVDLYRGAFLPADTVCLWATHRRETLKNILLRIVMIAGRHYELSRDWDRAADLYARGLEMDFLAEGFYQRLMICHSRRGDKAEAVKVYRHCRRMLNDHLGIEPSDETEKIYASLVKTN